jgi:ADP-ribose diphosphatase
MREQLRRYLELAAQRPDWFANPPNAAFAILLDEGEIQQAEAEQARRLMASGQPAEWAAIGIVYEDQYLTILRDAVRYLDGARGAYIRAVADLVAPGVVGVLPVYDGKILLIQHFRHATRDWRLEIPSGGCEPGATADDDARRELAEEIGGVPRRLVSMGYFHEDIGLSGGLIELWRGGDDRGHHWDRPRHPTRIRDADPRWPDDDCHRHRRLHLRPRAWPAARLKRRRPSAPHPIRSHLIASPQPRVHIARRRQRGRLPCARFAPWHAPCGDHVG